VPGIMATSSRDIRLFDIEHNEELENSIYSIAGSNNSSWISGISWDPSGHQIGFMTTKANWGIADLRDSTKTAQTLIAAGHDRASKCQMTLLGGIGGPLANTHVATSGYDRLGDSGRDYGKQIKLWDLRNLSETVDEFVLPGGDGSSQTDLHYEPSTGLLFTVDRGGSRLHVFDVSKEELQHIANLHEARITQNKFYTFLDRRYVDTSYGEFMRYCCIDKDNELVVERIFKESQPNLPGIRPGALGYMPELYPNCVGCKSSVKVDDWIASKFAAAPLKLTNMDPSTGPECLELDARKVDGSTLIDKTEWMSGKLKKTVHVVDEEDRDAQRHYMHIMMENENIKRLHKLVNQAKEATDMNDADARAVLDELRKMMENFEACFRNNATDMATLLQKCEDLEKDAAIRIQKALKKQGKADPRSEEDIREDFSQVARHQITEAEREKVPDRMIDLERRLTKVEQMRSEGEAVVSRANSNLAQKYEKQQKVFEGQVDHYKRKVKEKNYEIMSLRKQIEYYKRKSAKENKDKIDKQKCLDCDNNRKKSEALAAEINQYKLQFNEYERSR